MTTAKLKELISILTDVSELIGSGLFQLDNEIEDELFDEGVIENYSDVYEHGVDEAIKILKNMLKIRGNK
tara:strand:+ start:987 stop:1196 length:210 start_codon:yes stop_codon:yes gene_type:complete